MDTDSISSETAVHHLFITCCKQSIVVRRHTYPQGVRQRTPSPFIILYLRDSRAVAGSKGSWLFELAVGSIPCEMKSEDYKVLAKVLEGYS